MNERIKDIWLQAAREDSGDDWDSQMQFIERFARLIVKECAEMARSSQYVDTKSDYYEGFNEALRYISNKMKQRFGVEE